MQYEDIEIEQARKLFSGECKFIAAALKANAIPGEECNEIAFAGRSNVGKSSLVNALTNRKTLARTSQTPGRTRQLIFFELVHHLTKLRLVDLPGYGYAKAPKKDIQSWGKDTRNVIISGITSAISGAIQVSLDKLNKDVEEPVVIITGGDSEFFKDHLDRGFKFRPNLVLSGLAILASQ